MHNNIRTHRPSAPAPRRTAFTLIELVIVILVISILAAMLLPALAQVKARANDARCKGEIDQLATAIAMFKQSYGVEPPSRITLYQDWNTVDATTKATLRRIWPQFNFTATGTVPGMTGNVTLNGAECLMFFLGGIFQNAYPAVDAPTGFSKNPSNPFMTGGNREGPFIEFDMARFVDLNSNGFREYRDTFNTEQSPYLYFSSYEGSGYLAPATGAPTGVPPGSPELPPFGISPWTGFVDIYRTQTNSATQNGAAYKPQSFQIISAGADGLIGVGGYFNTSQPNSGLTNTYDYDNLTNFHSGRLKP